MTSGDADTGSMRLADVTSDAELRLIWKRSTRKRRISQQAAYELGALRGTAERRFPLSTPISDREATELIRILRRKAQSSAGEPGREHFDSSVDVEPPGSVTPRTGGHDRHTAAELDEQLDTVRAAAELDRLEAASTIAQLTEQLQREQIASRDRTIAELSTIARAATRALADIVSQLDQLINTAEDGPTRQG